MNAFDHLVRQLSAKREKAASTNITAAEYEVFCKEYLFDNLKEVSFGKAFCEKFNITDFVLDLLQSEKSAKKHINIVGYISGTDCK